MPSFALQFRGALTNVSGLVPAEGVDAALLIPIECTSCHEEHPNAVALEPSNVDEMQKSRGVANLVMHCPGCRRENAATFVVSKAEKLGEVSPWSAIDTDGDALYDRVSRYAATHAHDPWPFDGLELMDVPRHREWHAIHGRPV